MQSLRLQLLTSIAPKNLAWAKLFPQTYHLRRLLVQTRDICSGVYEERDFMTVISHESISLGVSCRCIDSHHPPGRVFILRQATVVPLYVSSLPLTSSYSPVTFSVSTIFLSSSSLSRSLSL